MRTMRRAVGCLMFPIMLVVTLLWGIAGLFLLVNLTLLRWGSAGQWLVIVLILAAVRFVVAGMLVWVVPDDEEEDDEWPRETRLPENRYEKLVASPPPLPPDPPSPYPSVALLHFSRSFGDRRGGQRWRRRSATEPI
ncbi:MAG: hypothetical protein M3R02_12635 [Chloroflexota bacterium]|nr:hypothetical protein [Chloroflexota bacterium]